MAFWYGTNNLTDPVSIRVGRSINNIDNEQVFYQEAHCVFEVHPIVALDECTTVTGYKTFLSSHTQKTGIFQGPKTSKDFGTFFFFETESQ